MPTSATEEMRRALLAADPRLSRFDPLSRILSYDDFDYGLQGWTALIGNYEDNLDAMLPQYQDLRGPMLSSLSMWDTGSDGSAMGNYALKLATRPRAGSLAVAIKRLTYRRLAPIRVEAYFAFKPEATELRLSESDVRAVGLLLDLQDVDTRGESAERVMPHIRYLNALDGQAVGQWQFKHRRETLAEIGPGYVILLGVGHGDGEEQRAFHAISVPTSMIDTPAGNASPFRRPRFQWQERLPTEVVPP